ncbi:fimbria/pilus outer membrane usher protein [Enterobacillus tribolii]|uniref:Outer membrane usher protein n=1 Tax=Enterobacillus tribolii TaxID=1487935 RepID=A0A370Q795_9GAMM|nr:fimbria/pilus outer membrane usher protein [Enterobacillus tribolii]MBW7984950.1 fimbrial biogenesis outer membrane usher protein [Enterobacillus tribolii]RDK83910.1 outer membrane usher protein [Enterobacillus tribolii]
MYQGYDTCVEKDASGGGRLILPLGLLCIVVSFSSPLCVAETDIDVVEFDPVFLNLRQAGSVDLSRFSSGAAAQPGKYNAEIYINSQQVGSEMIEIRERADKTTFPCVSPAVLRHVDFAAIGDTPAVPSAGEACIDLAALLPVGQVTFNSSMLRLDIIVPQKYLLKTARGMVNPALWDSGIPALLLGYNMNGYTREVAGRHYRSIYAGLNGGLNLGAWYLRHNGSYMWASDSAHQYESINTYLQRDIPSLSARLLVGQSNTTGILFDTLPFSGIQLASDERMLAESQRGYAPEIRGVARTNAKVEVIQNNQTIYEITVAPGEFVIDDLYPTGYGGDLRVNVREADGSMQTFTVPYASLAQLLRPGAERYSVTAGKLRSAALSSKPEFYEATYQRGMTNAITAYGGLQASTHYAALQLGASFATSFGALAFDVTQARAAMPGLMLQDGTRSGGTRKGQSYRLSFSKAIQETNSNLSLAAYRFSTRDYMDFMTAMQSRAALRRGDAADSIWRAKNRVTLTLGQGLPENLGQIYASASLQNYWYHGGYERQFQVGYSHRFRNVTYNLNVNRSRDNNGRTQDTYMLSLSFPLGRSGVSNTPQMRFDLAHDTGGRSRTQSSLSGTLGQDSAFSYNTTLAYANNGAGSSATLNGQYRSPLTQAFASFSRGNHYSSASAGLSGTLLAHAGGITLTPYTSDTFALVEAPGATGAKVSSYPGIRVDRRGYAAVPYLTPYQMNEISIDPKGMSHHVELKNTMQKTAPYSGAVVKLNYHTERGIPLLTYATYQGAPLPFGSRVFNDLNESVGSVGQAGQVFARVTQTQGQLRIQWGEDDATLCTINYALPATQKDLTPFTSVCR